MQRSDCRPVRFDRAPHTTRCIFPPSTREYEEGNENLKSRAQTRTGRPRDPARHAAILQATQDLLAEVGYDRLSIESVAARCGTGKTTIYRRWADKAALVADAVATAATQPSRELPDTGVLRDDLITLAAQWHSPDSLRDAIIAGLLTAMRHHVELRTAVNEAITQPAQQAFRLMVQRAVERGDVADGLPIDLIGAVLPAMVFHHITEADTPVDAKFIRSIIDHLVLPALCTQDRAGNVARRPSHPRRKPVTKS